MIASTGITLPALLSFIAFNMTTIPCFATVAATKGESVKKSTFNYTILFWVVTSFIVSMVIYLVGTFPWTLAIFIVIALVVYFAIKTYNKKREKID